MRMQGHTDRIFLIGIHINIDILIYYLFTRNVIRNNLYCLICNVQIGHVHDQVRMLKSRDVRSICLDAKPSIISKQVPPQTILVKPVKYFF